MKALRDSRITGFVLIGLLLLLWQDTATVTFNLPTWPPVSQVFASLFEKVTDGTLLTHLFATLWRQMLGFFLAVILGMSFGLAIGYFRPLHNLFEPLIELLRPIPGPAYLPVLVLFIGIGNDMKV